VESDDKEVEQARQQLRRDRTQTASPYAYFDSSSPLRITPTLIWPPGSVYFVACSANGLSAWVSRVSPLRPRAPDPHFDQQFMFLRTIKGCTVSMWAPLARRCDSTGSARQGDRAAGDERQRLINRRDRAKMPQLSLHNVAAPASELRIVHRAPPQ